jgi:hypothetical protein
MKRIAALLIAIVALTAFAGTATTDARALNPIQTTVTGVVNKELPDLNRLWTTSFTNWGWWYLWRNTGVGFYNPGSYTNYYSACGWTSSAFWVDNAVYCTNDFSIYVDQSWVQRLLNRYGDGAAAFILAHEFGHHAGHLQGRFVGKREIERELNADCLAGFYFRWGITISGVMHSNDYGEAVTMISYELGGDPAGHGTAQQRIAWFKYGYTSYNINSCNSVFSN